MRSGVHAFSGRVTSRASGQLMPWVAETQVPASANRISIGTSENATTRPTPARRSQPVDLAMATAMIPGMNSATARIPASSAHRAVRAAAARDDHQQRHEQPGHDVGEGDDPGGLAAPIPAPGGACPRTGPPTTRPRWPRAGGRPPPAGRRAPRACTGCCSPAGRRRRRRRARAARTGRSSRAVDPPGAEAGRRTSAQLLPSRRRRPVPGPGAPRAPGRPPVAPVARSARPAG